MAFRKYDRGLSPCKYCFIGSHKHCYKRDSCSCTCPFKKVWDGRNNQNKKKEVCIRGHLITEYNVYITKNKRRLCKECCSIRGKTNRQLHRDATIEHYHRNRKDILAKRRSINIEKRLKIIYHYSDGLMCCKLCGMEGYEFLTIDHIEGGGTKQRKRMKLGGSGFYDWIIKNNYPIGLQVLCYNCNCVKGTHGLKRLLSLLKERQIDNIIRNELAYVAKDGD